jgi:hypothetical protein
MENVAPYIYMYIYIYTIAEVGAEAYTRHYHKLQNNFKWDYWCQ